MNIFSKIHKLLLQRILVSWIFHRRTVTWTPRWSRLCYRMGDMGEDRVYKPPQENLKKKARTSSARSTSSKTNLETSKPEQENYPKQWNYAKLTRSKILEEESVNDNVEMTHNKTAPFSSNQTVAAITLSRCSFEALNLKLI